MTCPNCGQKMSEGEVDVRSSMLSFLVFPLSYQNLWWYPGGDRGKQSRRVALRPGKVRSGFRCDSCRTLVFKEQGAT